MIGPCGRWLLRDCPRLRKTPRTTYNMTSSTDDAIVLLVLFLSDPAVKLASQLPPLSSSSLLYLFCCLYYISPTPSYSSRRIRVSVAYYQPTCLPTHSTLPICPILTILLPLSVYLPLYLGILVSSFPRPHLSSIGTSELILPASLLYLLFALFFPYIIKRLLRSYNPQPTPVSLKTQWTPPKSKSTSSISSRRSLPSTRTRICSG